MLLEKEWKTHAAQHPRSVPCDLQAFDARSGHGHAHARGQSEQPDKHLRLDGPAERPTRDHEARGIGQSDQRYKHVAVDAVQYERFAPQHRRKLHGCQDASGDDDGEVEDYAGAVERLAEVESFSRRSILAEVTVDGQIWRSSEAEAEHGACEMEPEQCIVTFAEAKGGVGLAERADNGVWGFGFMGLGRHCDIRIDGSLRDARVGSFQCECCA